MKLRVLAFALAILAIFIFVGSPFEQAANAIATEVVIGGGLIAVILAALAAMGITFAAHGAYGDVQDWVSDELTNFASQQGTTVDGLFSGVNMGSNNLGQILVNNRFLQVMETFILYLKAKFSLTDNSRVNVQSGSPTFGGLIGYNLPFSVNISAGRETEYIVAQGEGIIVVLSKNRVNLIMNFLDTETGVVRRTITYPSASPSVTNLTLYRWNDSNLFRSTDIISLSSVVNIDQYYVYDDSVFQTVINSQIQPGDVPIDIVTGEIMVPSDNPAYQAGDGAVIDLSGPWGYDWQQIISILIPGIYVTDELEGTEITYDNEAAVEDQVTDTPAAQVSQNVSDYQVAGLPSVFPFCIPFDLYNFVSCLAADPVAPSFTWRFYVPGICDESIEIDLAEFNNVAQVLRTMELLLFCVGLAFVTRKIIRG